MTCPHGVIDGLEQHTPRNVLVTLESGEVVGVPLNVAGLPSGVCACCGAKYHYDAPLDERTQLDNCQHCQAITADPDVDHLEGNPEFRGGPNHGTRHAALPGLDPLPILTAGAEDEGHYRLAEDGHYDWVPNAITPIDHRTLTQLHREESPNSEER